MTVRDVDYTIRRHPFLAAVVFVVLAIILANQSLELATTLGVIR